MGKARQARSAQSFVFWAVYARAIHGYWHMQSLNEKNIWENIYFQVSIISKFWLLISSPKRFFRGHTSKRLAYCRTTAMSLLFNIRFHGQIPLFERSLSSRRGVPYPTTPLHPVSVPILYLLDTTFYYVVTDCETE